MPDSSFEKWERRGRALSALKPLAAAARAAKGLHGGDFSALEPLVALGAFEAEKIVEQANRIEKQREGKKKTIAPPILKAKEKIAQHHLWNSRHQLMFQPNHEFGQLPRGKVHGKSPPSPAPMIAYPAGSYKGRAEDVRRRCRGRHSVRTSQGASIPRKSTMASFSGP